MFQFREFAEVDDGEAGSGAREKAEEEEERSAITNNKFRKRRSLPPGTLKIPESGLERLVCEFTR